MAQINGTSQFTPQERTEKKEARKSLDSLNAMLDSLKPAQFNPLTNGQKIDLLRDGLVLGLKIAKYLMKAHLRD